MAAVLIAAAALAFAIWGNKEAGRRAQEASSGLNSYDYELTFLPEESALDVTMTLLCANRTGSSLDDLLLRTWAGAYQLEATSPAASEELYAACYPGGFSPGGIAIQDVTWNGQPVDYAYDDAACTALRISIPVLPVEGSGTLTLRARLLLPECAHRFGHASGVWQFGNVLPILSVYQDGAWRTDEYCAVGDPFISECANYSVTLQTPSGYLCACGGACQMEKSAEGLTYRITLPASRDFAFALSRDWQSATAHVNGIAVTAYGPTRKGVDRAVKFAAKALKAYANHYGDYAYSSYTLCAVDFPFGGMEYPGLTLLGLPYFADDWADSLELLIAHETAHQWFYALVGSDQYNDPWQDEALCEYAVLRYVRDVYGQSAYENLRLTRVEAPMRERITKRVTPGSPISHFDSLVPYTSVVYGRGAAFLLGVEKLTGRLDAFLRTYCDRFAFALAARADFLALLNDFTGEDLAPLMTDYLDTLMQ